MTAVVSFLGGMLVGAGLHWYFSAPREASSTAEASSPSTRIETTNSPSDNPFDRERIREELARTGRVIREKARQAGAAIADATADARITGSIKTKLIQQTNLAAFKIDVDTHEGAVTLSGIVSSPDDIARAMEIAYQTDGVHKVTSTLQVKAAQ